jgi:virginiamycin A acetyltransferase
LIARPAIVEGDAAERMRQVQQENRSLQREVERLREALARARGGPRPDPAAPRFGPSPLEPHPLGGDRSVAFLRPLITRPNIAVGEFTYLHEPDGAAAFERRNVLFQGSDAADRLEIGRFCSIASGVRLVMNGANHPDAGTTYPFWIFGRGWHESAQPRFRGPLRIGNDVWIGTDAWIVAGVTVGDGAIIGARAVVTRDVPPYAVVAGNPAREIRRRFDDATIARLLALRWWDWPAERITRNQRELLDGRWDDLT